MTERVVAIVGGGAAGLGAAFMLKKLGLQHLVLEANDEVGGRLRSERIDGFTLDMGADFFCSSYDTTFRVCKELGIPLIPNRYTFGWFRNGRWSTTSPGLSPGSILKRLNWGWRHGLFTPQGLRALHRLLREFRRDSKYLNYSSDNRLLELDGEETFKEYLDRMGVPHSLRVALTGFLELTMGSVNRSGQAYMRTYLAEILLKPTQISVPEYGAGALTEGLGDACADAIRTMTPVRRVNIRGGSVTNVVVDDGTIDVDAVICAVPPSRVLKILPDLPDPIRRTLSGISYSTGCRVVVGLDHPPLPPGWNGALYPEDDTPLLLDRTINLPRCAPEGRSTLDLTTGRARAKELMALDDEQITHALLGDARRNPPPGSSLPTAGDELFSRVYRWNEAVCMGLPGMFIAVSNAVRQLKKEIPNLILAGDYTRVPSVNGALASGIQAAEEVATLFDSRPHTL
ncbi:MAG: NAD(P)/FAD-dependent oxidoreductase [Chloroflexota bacterium]|nr:NAD(P)/FAD-dependent oxidoreductase [Chloroflexota bacterium]